MYCVFLFNVKQVASLSFWLLMQTVGPLGCYCRRLQESNWWLLSSSRSYRCNPLSLHNFLTTIHTPMKKVRSLSRCATLGCRCTVPHTRKSNARM